MTKREYKYHYPYWKKGTGSFIGLIPSIQKMQSEYYSPEPAEFSLALLEKAMSELSKVKINNPIFYIKNNK